MCTHTHTHTLITLTHITHASFAWQAWDNVHCQEVGCAPRCPSGVPWSPPLLRGRRGTWCTTKGSDVRPVSPLASLGLRLSCVAWDNAPRCPSGVPWSPPLLRGVGQCALRRGRTLGLRLFCVAGVGQCALPRGRMYAGVPLASLGLCTLRCPSGVPWSPPLLRYGCITQQFALTDSYNISAAHIRDHFGFAATYWTHGSWGKPLDPCAILIAVLQKEYPAAAGCVCVCVKHLNRCKTSTHCLNL